MKEKRCMGCMNTYPEHLDTCPHCGYAEGTPPKEAYHITPGTLLHDRYTIGRVLGFGGFGITYIGWDQVLQQTVAVKEYLPAEFATRVPGQDDVTIYSGENEHQFNIGKGRFAEEARRLARFNAVEGIVEIKDTFNDNGTAYLVMEYLEGETLKERLAREKKMTVDDTIPIIESVLKALEEVHKGEIVHRDIAPDNIFLCSDGNVKLIDFGASRYATVQHSKSLSVILKEGYAPEEQYRSRGVQGPWSDVYAVGATMYRMLTGKTPEDAMERAENDKVKPVGKMGVKISKARETALMNAMNVFAEDRTQSARQFLDELNADDVERKTRTRKKIDVGRWPRWTKVVIACLVLVLGGTGVFLTQKNTFALEEGQAYVPEVINMKDSRAKKKVERNDLVLRITGQESSEKVDKSKVMGQYPDSGRIVNTGDYVEVQVSAGNTVEMIDVVGLSRGEAKKLLEALGFRNIKFVEQHMSALPGTVGKQSVRKGEDADLSEELIITVSSGLEGIDPDKKTSVPSLEGLSMNKAMSKANKSKLYIKKVEVAESDKPAGTIISQSVSKGDSVSQGTVITVVVSGGKSKVSVPYVEYMSEGEAKSVLSSYGLKCSVTHRHSETVSPGLVMEQSVRSGKKVSKGTTVSITVSKGRTVKSVPNVSGMSVHGAADRIVNSGFRYSVNYVHSDRSWGDVISYYPSGKQERGTLVTINVSCGTSGKLVSEATYYDHYSDTSKYHASPRYRYSYRSKDYTTSGRSSLSGWTKYDSSTTTSVSGQKRGNVPKSRTTMGSSKVTTTPVNVKYYYYAYGVMNPNNTSDLTWYVDTSRQSCINHMKHAGYAGWAYAEDRLQYFWLIDANPNLHKKRNLNRNVHMVWGSHAGPCSQSHSKWYNFDLAMYRYCGLYNLKTTTTTYYYWKWEPWSSYGDWTYRQSESETCREHPDVAYYVEGKIPH